MGWAARRRGTFEDRKAQAIEKAAQAHHEMMERERLRIKNMTEEEKRAEWERAKNRSSIMSLYVRMACLLR